MAVKSPIRYFGGKSQLAKKHVNYEPSRYTVFGDCCVGGGSYLSVKDRIGVSEHANDLDGLLLNFFRVLQSPQHFAALVTRLESTPFSDQEFDLGSSILESPSITIVPNVEVAWAYFVVNRMSRMGLGNDYATRTRRTRRERNENVSAYRSAIESLYEFRDRILWVELRQMDLCEFIRLYDSPSTFFYVDPPYLLDTRVAGGYNVEMTEDDHLRLLCLLRDIEGKFMLCGYDHELYSHTEQECGWNRVEFQVSKSSSSSNTKPVATEILWRNYHA